MRIDGWKALLAQAASILIASAVLAGTGSTTTAAVATTLSGDQEVLAVTTTASGGRHLTFHEDRSVTGTIEAVAIDGTAAHIHHGAPGTNGPVVAPLTKSASNPWSMTAGTRLTAEQYQSYRDGQTYVNVHSAAHAGGEIRLQLTP